MSGPDCRGEFWQARDKLEVDNRLRVSKGKRRMVGFYVMLMYGVVGGACEALWEV